MRNLRTPATRHASLVTASGVLACVLAFGSGACGDADVATKFVGTWTFQSGMLTPACGQTAQVAPFSLAGVSVMITKIDNTTIQLSAGAAGCDVRFGVSGDKASVQANQSCMLDVGGAFGVTTIGISTWTLQLSGDQIDSMTTGFALVCTVSGSGVLARGGPAGDAGAD